MKRSIEDMHIAGYYSNAIMRCFALSYCTLADSAQSAGIKRHPVAPGPKPDLQRIGRAAIGSHPIYLGSFGAPHTPLQR